MYPNHNNFLTLFIIAHSLDRDHSHQTHHIDNVRTHCELNLLLNMGHSDLGSNFQNLLKLSIRLILPLTMLLTKEEGLEPPLYETRINA